MKMNNDASIMGQGGEDGCYFFIYDIGQVY